jgi:hypothetical protein
LKNKNKCGKAREAWMGEKKKIAARSREARSEKQASKRVKPRNYIIGHCGASTRPTLTVQSSTTQ